MRSGAFKFIDRGKPGSLVLVPGWATDYRIFAGLDLNFNYIIPIKFSPASFLPELGLALKEKKLSTISLFGWSLGAFLACQFASRHINMVDQLILVGLRKNYDPAVIEDIKDSLRLKKESYLYKFYGQCFHDQACRRQFKQGLLKRYCRQFTLDYLIAGLDYLKEVQLAPQRLAPLKRITLIHGQHDNIAPLSEAQAIKNKLPQAKFILVPEAGHLAFLEKDLGCYNL